MNIDLGSILKIATVAPSIVQNVKDMFGKTKTGPEKFEIAKDTASKVVATANGVTHQEVLNDAGVQALIAEAIQIGYDIMKLKERLAQIDDLLKGAKGSGQPQG